MPFKKIQLLPMLSKYDVFMRFEAQLRYILEWQVKKERAEREALGALPLYQRTIP